MQPDLLDIELANASPSRKERAVTIGLEIAKQYFLKRRGKSCGVSQANLSQMDLAAVCALAAEMALGGGK
jgi:hypothetical protein